MAKPRGKLIAINAGTIALVILVAVGIASKDWLLEEYYIRMLDSTEENKRALALRRLGEIQSARTTPTLARLLGRRRSVHVFINEDIRNVLEFLAIRLDFNLVFSSEIKGTVSVFLKEPLSEDTIRSVVTQSGYMLMESETETFKIYRVALPPMSGPRSNRGSGSRE